MRRAPTVAATDPVAWPEAYEFSTPLNGAVPVTAASYSDPGSGLTGASAYAYVVRALGPTGASTSSNELTATTVARPAAPAGLTATAAAGGQVNIGWSNAADLAGYDIYRRTSDGAYDYAAPLNGSTLNTGTSFTDATAVNATTYRYAIRAVSTGAGGARVESVDSLQTAAVTADSIAPSTVTLTDPGSPLRGPSRSREQRETPDRASLRCAFSTPPPEARRGLTAAPPLLLPTPAASSAAR